MKFQQLLVEQRSEIINHESNIKANKRTYSHSPSIFIEFGRVFIFDIIFYTDQWGVVQDRVKSQQLNNCILFDNNEYETFNFFGLRVLFPHFASLMEIFSQARHLRTTVKQSVKQSLHQTVNLKGYIHTIVPIPKAKSCAHCVPLKSDINVWSTNINCSFI